MLDEEIHNTMKSIVTILFLEIKVVFFYKKEDNLGI